MKFVDRNPNFSEREKIDAALEKVMHRDLSTSLRSLRMDGLVNQLNVKLHQATSARRTYEGASDLPLEDLFHVGGMLSHLIRECETALSNLAVTFPDQTRPLMEVRVQEAKAFRKYIIKRILEVK